VFRFGLLLSSARPHKSQVTAMPEVSSPNLRGVLSAITVMLQHVVRSLPDDETETQTVTDTETVETVTAEYDYIESEGNQLLSTGKHKDNSFKVAYEDETYRKWYVARAGSLECPEHKRFAKYCIERQKQM
jgi:hypothetical protein